MLALPAFFPLFFIFSSVCQSAYGNEPTDSATTLKEVTVSVAPRKLMSTPDLGATSLNVDAAGRLTRMFGEADPLRYARMSGGLSAAGDYSSGLSAQGAGFSQSLFRVGRATVFFPYHFGGIFSMFNSLHFPTLYVEKSIHDVSAASRLGALFDVRSRDRHPDRFRGTVNVGMTASSLGLRIPVSDRFSLDLSGRISYIDKLYGPMLDMKDQTIRYSFSDAALTARWTPSDADLIKVDALLNSDHLNVFDHHYYLDTHLDWGNLAASAIWSHESATPFKLWGAFSGFSNTLIADIPGIDLHVPSEMMEGNIGFEIDIPLKSTGSADSPADGSSRYGMIKAGAEALCYASLPQDIYGLKKWRRASEARLYASWVKRLGKRFSLDVGLKGSYYSSAEYRNFFAAPEVSVSFDNGRDRSKLHFSVYPQYLHQTGYVDVGLSSNFWITASSAAPVEKAIAVSAAYERVLLDGKLTIGVEPYFKKILHEPEYSGILLELLESDYNLDSHLLVSNGFNAGFDLTLRFTAGRFSASGAYSLGFARRKYPTAPDRYLPSVSEGLHNLNAFLSYSFGRGWNIGATFTLSSGRCYTPVRAVYMIGENVMLIYGDRNSARMPIYHRLDLSGSYTFQTGGRFPLRHSVVLSVINAYGRRNIELCSYRMSADDGTFYLHKVPSLYRFLPSLSYSVEF